jgi:DNA-directed RNA polymerase subunit M/transcription elongation factor TFIIS
MKLTKIPPKIPTKKTPVPPMRKPQRSSTTKKTPSDITENAGQLLRKIINTMNENNDVLSDITDLNIEELTRLRYSDRTSIIDIARPDVILEIAGMLNKYPYSEVLIFLQQVKSVDDLLWDQPSMDEYHLKFEREIAIYKTEEKGTVNFGKCRFCPSTELAIAMKQTRSGDEPLTVFVSCVKCGKRWRQ